MSPPLTIPDAIAAHRAAYDAFQIALEGEPSIEANDTYDAASEALVSVSCADRVEAASLLAHLRWWIADEAENDPFFPAFYRIAQARAADLTMLLDPGRCGAAA